MANFLESQKLLIIYKMMLHTVLFVFWIRDTETVTWFIIFAEVLKSLLCFLE